MTLEKLTEFTQEDLRYKSSIKVISYEIIGNWIDLQFYNWVKEKREEKLFHILE